MLLRSTPRRLFSSAGAGPHSFDIKLDYYKMAKKWHPDLNPAFSAKQKEEAHVKFMAINSAY